MSALIVALALSGGLRISGAVDGLVPVEQRLADPELWVLLYERGAAPASDPADAAGEEGSAIERATIELGEQLETLRVPVAPPASDAAMWLDAHRLYLVPPRSEAALAERLDGDAIHRAVAGIRARLSSPLYSVSGEEPRRDPLRLRELMDARPGQLGFMSVEGDDGDGMVGPSAPRVTVAGDLIAADGRAALMRLILPDSEAALARLADALRAGLEGRAIDFAIVGRARREASARASVRAHTPRVVVTALALLTLLLSVTLRSVRALAGVMLCALGGALAAAAAGRGALGTLDIPLLVLTLGFVCEGALQLPRLSSRGWPAALIMATALLPLALSPYPAWRAWAWQWPAGVLVAALGLRLALPGLLRLTRRGLVAWPRPGAGFALRPAPAFALLLCAASLAGGAWSIRHIEFRGGHPLPTADVELRADELRLARAFFDPGLLAELRVSGATPAEALERGAARAGELRALLDTAAARVDSPGMFVASAPAITARAELLERLELQGALERLEQELAASGMRPAAFSEFLEAARASEAPSAEAALAGPLGAWAAAYLDELPGGGHELRARVHLRRDFVEAAGADAGAAMPWELRGPALAVLEDRRDFDERLGLLVATGLWLVALWVGLGTRRLSTAVAAALTSLAAESCLLLLLDLLGVALGPITLPALLLVGASAMIAGGRACQAVDERRPFPAKGLLLTSACQIAAGLALLGSPEPLWRVTGLIIACGCALASGFGVFVGPGLCALIRRAARVGDRGDRDRGARDRDDRKDREDREDREDSDLRRGEEREPDDEGARAG